MKSLLILAIALVSSSAYANNNCGAFAEGTTQTVQGGYERDGYVPETFRTCVAGQWILSGPGYKKVTAADYAKHKLCSVEGVTQKVQGGYERDGYVPEIFRTCTNGRWVLSGPGHKAAPDYSKIGCKEGTRFTNYDRDNGNTNWVCVAGKYVQY